MKQLKELLEIINRYVDSYQANHDAESLEVIRQILVKLISLYRKSKMVRFRTKLIIDDCIISARFKTFLMDDIYDLVQEGEELRSYLFDHKEYYKIANQTIKRMIKADDYSDLAITAELIHRTNYMIDNILDYVEEIRKSIQEYQCGIEYMIPDEKDSNIDENLNRMDELGLELELKLNNQRTDQRN